MLVTYRVQNGIFDFTAQQVGWLIATPILSGARSRVPLGILRDKYGGRIVMAGLMAACAVPIWGARPYEYGFCGLRVLLH